MRLGREAGSFGRTRTAISRRVGNTVHGGISQKQHQRREGILQLGSRYQEEDYRHVKDGSRALTRCECGGSEQWHEFDGGEMLLGTLTVA